MASTSDTRYPHLPLIYAEPNPERRKKRGFGSSTPPNRGGRENFGNAFAMQIGRLEEQAKEKPQPMPEIQPHLVFRVPVANKAPMNQIAERLRDVDVDVVSIEPNNAIIVFRDDNSLDKFKEAIEEYRNPRTNPTTRLPYASTKWDVFEFIEPEEMTLFSRKDRIGNRLAQEIGADGEDIETDKTYILDVEVWHRGNIVKARENLAELRTLVENTLLPQGHVYDDFVGESLCIARIAVVGAKLDILLDMDSIAEIDFPPISQFNEIAVRRATSRDFPTPPLPPENGPRLCVVDSGITSNHPLLKSNVGHEEAIFTKTTTPADEHGHGTMVAGVAVFGNVRGCYDNGQFASPITLFSARVLNDQNSFDDEQLIYNQIRKAIETFVRPPYNCRVFNLSLGTLMPANTDGGRRQTQWATVLDVLARDLKVLLVVSTGNNISVFTNNIQKAEHIKQDYPIYMFEPEAALCDPATAAIAITVGALAEYDMVTPGRSTTSNDLALPVAGRHEPSPLSRVGPGINHAIKPEFVDYGGNVVFEGFGSLRRCIPYQRHNPGTAVMSFAREVQSGLFTFDVGTSFAAPRVARLAALVSDRLKQQRNEEPHPNLIRAVLATAASVPEPARHVLERHKGEQGVLDVCGYGMIDEDTALSSRNNRVTLCTQGRITLDTFRIYEVPIPIEFLNAPNKKTITVALAFDPPVRRRRLDYIGVTMKASLIRGKTPEEIAEAYRAVSEAEREDAPGAIKGRFLCGLQPGTKKLDTSTLQRSVWQFDRGNADDGDSYYLVVWAIRKWAAAEITDQEFIMALRIQTRKSAQIR